MTMSLLLLLLSGSPTRAGEPIPDRCLQCLIGRPFDDPEVVTRAACVMKQSWRFTTFSPSVSLRDGHLLLTDSELWERIVPVSIPSTLRELKQRALAHGGTYNRKGHTGSWEQDGLNIEVTFRYDVPRKVEVWGPVQECPADCPRCDPTGHPPHWTGTRFRLFNDDTYRYLVLENRPMDAQAMEWFASFGLRPEDGRLRLPGKAYLRLSDRHMVWEKWADGAYYAHVSRSHLDEALLGRSSMDEEKQGLMHILIQPSDGGFARAALELRFAGEELLSTELYRIDGGTIPWTGDGEPTVQCYTDCAEEGKIPDPPTPSNISWEGLQLLWEVTKAYKRGMKRLAEAVDTEENDIIAKAKSASEFTTGNIAAREAVQTLRDMRNDPRFECPAIRPPLDDLIDAFQWMSRVYIRVDRFFEAAPPYRPAHLEAVQAQVDHAHMAVLRVHRALDEVAAACNEGREVEYDSSRFLPIPDLPEYPDLPTGKSDEPDWEAVMRDAQNAVDHEPTSGVFIVWYQRTSTSAPTCGSFKVYPIPPELGPMERVAYARRKIKQREYLYVIFSISESNFQPTWTQPHVDECGYPTDGH